MAAITKWRDGVEGPTRSAKGREVLTGWRTSRAGGGAAGGVQWRARVWSLRTIPKFRLPWEEETNGAGCFSFGIYISQLIKKTLNFSRFFLLLDHDSTMHISSSIHI